MCLNNDRNVYIKMKRVYQIYHLLKIYNVSDYVSRFSYNILIKNRKDTRTTQYINSHFFFWGVGFVIIYYDKQCMGFIRGCHMSTNKHINVIDFLYWCSYIYFCQFCDNCELLLQTAVREKNVLEMPLL